MNAARTCKARNCENTFTPRVRTQRYCSTICKNREAQRRLQKRAKLATARMSA